MIWLLLVACTIAFVELFIRLHLLSRLSSFSQLNSKIKQVITSKLVADHWKEKVLPIYAGQLFCRSIRFAGCLLLCAAAFIVFLLPFSPISEEFSNLLYSWRGVLISTLIAALYSKIRTLGSTSGNYGALSRILHRIALGNNIVPELTFDIEQLLLKNEVQDRSLESHVFVSGLARAGTTTLMRILHETDEFRSLTYRDMPFLLAPNTWQKLRSNNQDQSITQERAHGDGVMIDFDSPEALDEVFWRVHYGDKYILPDRLIDAEPDQASLDGYRTYVDLLLHGTDKRYLSKNNNNILRIPSLIKTFPNCKVLIPIREPLHQAESLRRQHQLFCDQQKKDTFTLSYMDWLCHFEFGQNQKPFIFKGTSPSKGNPEEIDYWLQQWVNVYQHLLPLCGKNVIPLAYEDLTENSTLIWKGLFEFLNISEAPPRDPMNHAKTYDVSCKNNTLMEEADSIYLKFRQKCPFLTRQGTNH